MRRDVFYWKCDQPRSVESKKALFFADKYSEASTEAARSIVLRFLRDKPVEFTPLKVDGNHFAYRFRHGEKQFLLRTDDGVSDDCYMLAESAVMDELSRFGLPVPKVFMTSTERKEFPVRYQIMEFIDSPSLQTIYQQGTLDLPGIAREFGLFLSRLHQHHHPGFGFIDTEVFSRENRICGMDPTWEAYFTTCLPKHLGYLQDHQLVSVETIRQIEQTFRRGSSWLTLSGGSLLHRDFTFWNILGTPEKISAVIDWDDVVIGDPADDLGIVNCFQSPEFMEILLQSYSLLRPVDECFRQRIWFYTLRNMLWKTMIRHYMGYFEKGDSFFLTKTESGLPLWEYSLSKIDQSINQLRAL